MRGWEVGEEAGCVVLAGLTHLATLVAVGPCLYGPDGFGPLGLQLCLGGDDRPPIARGTSCPGHVLVPWAHSPIWSRQHPIFVSLIQIAYYKR